MRVRPNCLPLYLLLVTLAGPALATDGVLEINQTCALGTGCFSGDAAGWPVTIDGSAGRSYRLTGDLVLPNVNTDGIYITTHDIGIDLNNFTIIGAACVGATTTSCRPLGGTGTGSGVEVDSFSTRFGISVSNGSITGMGRRGVSLGVQAEVRNLRVRWNGAHGIFAGTGSTITGNTARQNVGNGISTTEGSTVSGNTAFANGGDGIAATSGSAVSGNTARSNGGNGISATDGSAVSGNIVALNLTNGISVSDGCTVSENTAFQNSIDGITSGISSAVISRNSAYQNGDDGITAGANAIVSSNTMAVNGGYGFRIQRVMGVGPIYRDNTIYNNITGPVTGGGGNVGGNICIGPNVIAPPTCP